MSRATQLSRRKSLLVLLTLLITVIFCGTLLFMLTLIEYLNIKVIQCSYFCTYGRDVKIRAVSKAKFS